MKQLWIILSCAIALAPVSLVGKAKPQKPKTGLAKFIEITVPALKIIGFCLLIGLGVKAAKPPVWTCPICYEEFGSQRGLIDICKNKHTDKYCVPCARTLIRGDDPRCPMCREDLDTTKIRHDIRRVATEERGRP